MMKLSDESLPRKRKAKVYVFENFNIGLSDYGAQYVHVFDLHWCKYTFLRPSLDV